LSGGRGPPVEPDTPIDENAPPSLNAIWWDVAPQMREPFNPNSGRFGLLPSLLEEFFQPSNSDARGASFTLDIEETESAYQLTVDLPELEKSDINIDLHENTLTLSAERKEEFNRGARPVA
jgi:HSP20 family molecular chaperone IbpA